VSVILVLIYGQNNFNILSANTAGVRIPVTQKPNSSTIFTGRQDVLDKLEKIFIHQVTGRLMSRNSCLLWGMGGIGKTQICLKFMEEMSHK
jgi:Holliday junction resolvasome RuvABC ATP-dependent DNA helicase subunit